MTVPGLTWRPLILYLFVAILFAASPNFALAEARCLVADPSDTPLNVRTAPDGRIVSTLQNGEPVRILSNGSDRSGQPWVYVSEYDTKKPLGWVFRSYLTCDESPQPQASEQPPQKQPASSTEAWRACHSSDAENRLKGCTTIINAKGFGSTSRLGEALDGRCWSYDVKGQFSLAVEDCKASIALRPKYSYAYNNLGIAYLGLGEYQNALAALDSAVKLKPDFFGLDSIEPKPMWLLVKQMKQSRSMNIS
jgi:tetratricopeptide (TPR) repeat protein